MEKGWIKIQTYRNAILGELDKQLLAEHGLAAVILNKQDSSYMFGNIELFIHEKDEVEARAILAQKESEADEN